MLIRTDILAPHARPPKRGAIVLESACDIVMLESACEKGLVTVLECACACG